MAEVTVTRPTSLSLYDMVWYDSHDMTTVWDQLNSEQEMSFSMHIMLEDFNLSDKSSVSVTEQGFICPLLM